MKHPRDGLQQQHDLLVEKLARLRKAYAIETNPGVHLQLEEQIKQAEKELRNVDRQFTPFMKYARELAFACGAVAFIALAGIYAYYAAHKQKPPEPGSIVIGGNIQGDGNVVNTGTVNIGILKEEYLELAKQLGVTEEKLRETEKQIDVSEAAFKQFFAILDKNQIPIEARYSTLLEIANRYKELLAKVSALEADDPEVQTLKSQAQKALENGEFYNAEVFLNQASAKDVAAAKQLQEIADKRLLSAAEAKAQNGQLKLTQLAYMQSAAYYQEAIELLPKGHDEILADYLNNAGGALDFAGQYAQAQPMFERALAIREQVLGNEHPDVATSLNNLAVLYYAQGKYAEVEPLHQRALTIREQVLGNEHPDVATSLNNLAELYYAQGKYAEAEPLHQRALAIGETVLGKDHPHVATSLNNLAGLYHAQRKYAEAEPLYQRALAIREQVLGGEHPDVATSLNNLAMLYLNQGKYEQAKPLLERALKILQKHFGSDHPKVRACSENYAALLEKLASTATATPTPP